MKKTLILALALLAGAAFAAPSTPITRGRLTTDLDAGGHSVTNSNLATTNFVWEVVGAVTNNLPSGGGIDGGVVTNIVDGIFAETTNKFAVIGADGKVEVNQLQVLGPVMAGGYDAITYARRNGIDLADVVDLENAISGVAHRTNLPPLSASSTVGDLVDRVNAVIGAFR